MRRSFRCTATLVLIPIAAGQAGAPHAAAPLAGSGTQAISTTPGVNFDGAPLAADDKRLARNTTPLNLRRNCAWGVPGGNPYRGTVQQALAAAQLPDEVVRQIGDLADRGWVREQVEISRNGIRTLDGRRRFDTNVKAMGFGNTMCFNMRINFKPGHVEYASLYEAADHSGNTYSVMVPYVCNNVSVLGERYEEEDHKVPEPATWAILALGAGLLGWFSWRARGRGPS